MDNEKIIYIGNSSLMGAKISSLTNRIREDVVDVVSRMTGFELSEIPSFMDNYTASLFLPHDEPVPVSLQPAKPKYKRIVLITSLAGAETIEYIEQKTGLPVEHLTSYFAPNRIETIKEGDLVLFETSNADHQRYYAAKAKARAVNAAFMHYSGSNKDRIAHAVLNVSPRKGPYQHTFHAVHLR